MGSGNNKKKIENLVFILVLLIITVAAINFIWKDDKNKDENFEDESSVKLVTNAGNEETQDSLEKRLENILSNINGVR